MSEVKVGLALGGGGARGFCHIGVLKTLEENGIIPYAIAGTSMGAVVGGLYASGTSIDEMKQFVEKIKTYKIADYNLFSMYRDSLLKGNKVKKYISDYIKQKNIEDCAIKFACLSFDLNSGKEVEFYDGDLCDAIYSSMAVPALFRPLEKDGMRLVDGGVQNNLPHQLLTKMGCNCIICIDATGKYDGHRYKKNALTTIVNILNIFVRQQQELLKDKNNIYISPKLDGILNFSFNKKDGLKAIEAGRIATKKALPRIKKKIDLIKEGKNV